MTVITNAELSPREHVLLEHEKEEARLAREHSLQIKRLELELQRDDNAARVEIQRLEAKWASWLRLPSLFIRLPLLLILSVAYCLAVCFNYQPPKRFWDLLL